MLRKFYDLAKSARSLARFSVAIILMSFATCAMCAGNCTVVHHPPPSPADTAFLAADYAKAEGLYRADLAKSPADADLTAGLIHSLLSQMKVQTAADVLRAPGQRVAESPAMMTLRGEVELKGGDPEKAVETAVASVKLDPCNPRTLLLLSKLEDLNSQYATARKMLMSAHRLDSEDPEIRLAWLKTLPVAQRIPEMEAYLAAPRGDSPEQRGFLQADLGHLKAWASEPRKPCTMSSPATNLEVPFVAIQDVRAETIAYGLNVKVNDHTVLLAVDTSYNTRQPIDGFSGVEINRPVAQKWGLKPAFQNDVAGTGGQVARGGFVAIADRIVIGGLEFHDCAVQVMDGNFPNNADGIIGMDLLSSFLVTFDYPGKKLVLSPLPPRPQQASSTDGLYNRYIAPEMKDYIPVFRSGTDVILPMKVSEKWTWLFVLDTAVGYTYLSPEGQFEFNMGHRDDKYEARDANGRVPTSYTGGHAKLAFGDVSWMESPIGSFDTSRFTDDAGAEISGLLGLKSLGNFTTHIDYRDGLVKLDFDPKRKTPFSF